MANPPQPEPPEPDSQALEAVLTRISSALLARGWMLATAESCTGGMIAHLMTQVSGASETLIESAVTYSNDAKMRRLGVKKETLEKHGAVSEQCVREMAAGIAKESGADLCVSVSGIAGPTGGSDAKPVGTVWMALWFKGQTSAWHMRMPGEREVFKWRVARTALNALRLTALHGKPPERPTFHVTTVDAK